MVRYTTANRTRERAKVRAAFATWLLMLFILIVAALPARGQDEARGNEYRLTLFPYHRISDKVTGFGYLGYVNNPDKNYQTFYVGWPGVNYTINKSVQLWAGLVFTYTNYENSSDKLELRPFIGVKLFLPNKAKWNIYNFTRYEYRAIQDSDTHDWTNTSRLRSRFGVEFPFASRDRAWQPKTLYGIVDIEPYYRFDRNEVDPLRIRAGIGYVLDDRFRFELIYHAQFTHPDSSSGLKFTDNIFRLNIKIGLSKGIIGRLLNPDLD